MNILEKESGLLIMCHDNSIKIDTQAFSNPIKSFFNKSYSKIRKKENFKYKISFERKNNIIFLDYASSDINCSLKDFLIFKKSVNSIIINSQINEIILPNIVNKKLELVLPRFGFEKYKNKGIKKFRFMFKNYDYNVPAGYKKIISRNLPDKLLQNSN